MRLWKEDKLLLASIVLFASLLVASVFWAVDTYPRDGLRSFGYPLLMAYVLLRLIQMARQRLIHDEVSAVMDRAKRLEATDPAAAVDLEMVEKAERRTRDDLERVRAILKQLKP